MGIDGCIHDGWLLLRPKSDKIYPDYFYHLLGSSEVYQRFASRAAGATVKNLNSEIVREVEISFPPFDEQRRIAAILDQADDLRRKRREAIPSLDKLTLAVAAAMFGEARANLNGFDVRRLDQVTDCLDRKRRPVKESDRIPGNVPYYGANGQQGWIDTALFDEDLVLVAEDGGHFDEPWRGVAYRISGPAWVNNHAHILRPKPDQLDVTYLHYALKHYDFTAYISGSTRSKLTQAQLNGAKIIVPPLDLQRAFAARAAEIDKLKDHHHMHLGKLDALFASLQHRAFRGEV